MAILGTGGTRKCKILAFRAVSIILKACHLDRYNVSVYGGTLKLALGSKKVPNP